MGFGKDNQGVIIRERATLTIGALASVAAIKATAGIAGNLLEDFRLIKSEFFINEDTGFQAVGDQLIIGICNGALVAAEIAETMITDGPLNRSDRANQEHAERFVKPLFMMSQESAALPDFPPNNKMMMDKTIRWTFSNPNGWAWFAFNPLSGAITTGSVFTITAVHYGVWVS